jgi:hypothetical protein
MHNCQRIDWISKKKNYFGTIYCIDVSTITIFMFYNFYSRNSKWIFFLFYGPYRLLQRVWFKVAFFLISNKNSHWVRIPKRLPWVTFSDYISSCQGRRNQGGKGVDPPHILAYQFSEFTLLNQWGGGQIKSTSLQFATSPRISYLPTALLLSLEFEQWGPNSWKHFDKISSKGWLLSLSATCIV